MARFERISGPLVLALASGMFSIGVLLLLNRDYSQYAPEVPESSRVELRLDSAEATAETFLDAWRKREHPVARHLSTGPARNQVDARAAEDASLEDEEHEVKHQVWDVISSSRLTYVVDERQPQGDGVVLLRGRATGDFLGRPYERRVGFVMQERGDEWRVAEMVLGDHLTEVPGFLQGDLTPPGAQQ